MSSLWFLAACFGLTNAVSLLKIGKPLRELARRIPPRYLWESDTTPEKEPRSLWLDLVECHACAGFWIGVGLSIAFWSPSAPWVTTTLSPHIIDGLSSSAFCFGVNKMIRELPDAAIEWLERKRESA